MQHSYGKDRKCPGQQIAEHKQHSNILQVKPQKCRISAESIYTVCHKFRPVPVRDACPPAVLHAQNRNQEDNITRHTDAKSGESGIRRQMAPIKCDGQQLCKDSCQRCSSPPYPMRPYSKSKGYPTARLSCSGRRFPDRLFPP